MIKSLIIPEGKYGGVTNPSIYNDNGKLLCILRHVKYSLYHCKKHPHRYGPLQYIHREDSPTLETINYIAELDDNLNIKQYKKVEMLPYTPEWHFIGLEDARLVRWEDTLYLSGVRRDKKPNGEGRMELTALDTNYNEVTRERIEPPIPSYCEKNWMPILDQPYHFVKWSNPVEVVNRSQQVFLGNSIQLPRDLRGGSQVIPYKDNYIAITHECTFFVPKNAIYRHRIIVWDREWNLKFISNDFSFLNAPIEFCTGITIYNNNIIISFGLQDSCAYLMTIPLEKFLSMLNLT